jgi:hypothetical protein
MEGSCENGNEPLSFIKCWEILEWQSDWRLFKKGLDPWSKLVKVVP